MGNQIDDIVVMDDFLFAEPTAAVPEPETYAMLLAGFGLLGFAAFRRKQKTAESDRAAYTQISLCRGFSLRIKS